MGGWSRKFNSNNFFELVSENSLLPWVKNHRVVKICKNSVTQEPFKLESWLWS